MNVYDFDGTLYDGDSSVDFIRYCICKRPLAGLRLIPAVLRLGLYLIGLCGKEQFKSAMFAVVRSLDDTEGVVRGFWDAHRGKLRLSLVEYDKEAANVIISASPEFLLSQAATENGALLIASKVDPVTGRWLGANCRGKEKVRRFLEVFGETKIERFYSDSISDAPMAELAKNAYMVSGAGVIAWHMYKPSFMKKAKDMFINPQFFTFLFCGGLSTLANMLFAAIFAMFFDPTLSYALGYGCAICINYTLNSLVVFKQPLSPQKFLKFVISYIPNFCILFTLVAVFINVLGWNHIAVYGIAAVIAIPITFILLKIYAFRKPKGNHNDKNVK